jgi:hypothetical protein
MTAMTAETAAAWSAAVAVARAGRWASWTGLPAVPVAAVLADLAGSGPVPPVPGRLGRRSLDRFDAGPLHVWAAPDGTALLVEWVDPPCAGAATEVVAALGAPEREGAGRYLRAGATTTEYVYAGRGLAVTVAASYDQPPRFAPVLATVQLFAPGSLRDFVLELGGDDRLGPRPIGPRPR